jgi:hypothetical protein
MRNWWVGPMDPTQQWYTLKNGELIPVNIPGEKWNDRRGILGTVYNRQG